MNQPTNRAFEPSPFGVLREAVRSLPAMKYALGVGGIAAVVAIVVVGWRLPGLTAILGGICVIVGMVVLVIFAALASARPGKLTALAMFMAWSFLGLTVITAALLVSCAFAQWPTSLTCLLGDCGQVDGKVQPTVRDAEAILRDAYAGKFESIYSKFSPSVQQNLSFPAFRDVAQHQLLQVAGGPIHRTLRYKPVPEGNTLMIQYQAEFDTLSTWLETVVFVRVNNAWALYHLDVQPLSWSSTAPGSARVLPEQTPADALNGPHKTELVGAWTPPSGWRVNVLSTHQKAERTCDVELSAGGITLLGRDVLGVCSQKPGAPIFVIGKVAAAGPGRIELEQVRFAPPSY